MRMRMFAWAVGAFSLWLAPPAQAGLIYLANDSYIAVGPTLIPSTGSLYFSQSIGGQSGFANESFTLTANGFGGLGGATSTLDPAHAVFDLTFSVDSPTPFSMHGDTSGNIPGVVTLSTAFLSDSSGAMQVFDVSLAFTGVLTPDKQYRLYVAVDPPVSWAANWNLGLTLPVPEPSPAVLLFSALGAFALRTASRG